jgi:hypothetical protein
MARARAASRVSVDAMQGLSRRLRVAPGTVAATAATVVALYSAWHSGGQVWRGLSSEQRTYAAYSDAQRVRAPLDKIPLPSDIFDFYRAYVGRGDRIYYQVLPSGFGQFFDLPSIVAASGRFYLLPAVQEEDLRHANVVVSYFQDPGLLHVHFVTQERAGLQPIFVTRIGSR